MTPTPPAESFPDTPIHRLLNEFDDLCLRCPQYQQEETGPEIDEDMLYYNWRGLFRAVPLELRDAFIMPPVDDFTYPSVACNFFVTRVLRNQMPVRSNGDDKIASIKIRHMFKTSCLMGAVSCEWRVLGKQHDPQELGLCREANITARTYTGSLMSVPLNEVLDDIDKPKLSPQPAPGDIPLLADFIRTII